MSDGKNHDCFYSSGPCPTCGQNWPECNREALLAFLAEQERIYSNPRYPAIALNVLGAVRVAIRDGTYLRWKKP